MNRVLAERRKGVKKESETQTQESSFSKAARVPVEVREMLERYSEALVEATQRKMSKN